MRGRCAPLWLKQVTNVREIARCVGAAIRKSVFHWKCRVSFSQQGMDPRLDLKPSFALNEPRRGPF
jgi:hypothetical protein